MMLSKTSFLGAALLCALILTSWSSAAVVTNRHKVVAQMFGTSAGQAKAAYESCLMDGVKCKQFSVVIDGAAPNKSTAVYVDGLRVGTVTTDSLGHGKIKYRTAAFIGESNSTPIASNFQRIDSGGVIKVGRMAGVFFDSIDDGDAQEFEVEGEFTGVPNAEGEVSYEEELEDGVLDREFELEYEGALPGEVLNITVNGVVVYTVTADANGEVHLLLESTDADGDDEDGDSCDDGGDDDEGEHDDSENAVVIPDTFPSIVAGDVVGIGLAIATMSVDDEDEDDDEDDDEDEDEDEDDDDDDDDDNDDDDD